MKGFNILVIALAALGLTALGAALLWTGTDLQPQIDFAAIGAQVATTVEGWHPELIALGLLCSGFGVFLAWGNLAARRWERLIVQRTPLGEVHISLAALEDLGRVVKNDVPGLRDLKLRVHASRRGLQVRARVSLVAGDDMGAVSGAVQAAIRKRMQQVLGPEQDIRPRVILGRVVPRGEDDDGAPRRRLRPPRP